MRGALATCSCQYCESGATAHSKPAQLWEFATSGRRRSVRGSRSTALVQGGQLCSVPHEHVCPAHNSPFIYLLPNETGIFYIQHPVTATCLTSPLTPPGSKSTVSQTHRHVDR
jgi:hypothetical protein